MSTAVDDAIKSGTQDCNKLVQDVAESMGYGAFKTNNLKADGIIEYLFSPARVETSMKEGWTFLTKGDDEKPRALTVDDAINMANAGQLVVGIMHSKLLNQLKSPADNDGRNYTHGHVFVVSPGGKAASSPEDTFRGMPVANAGNGMIAKKTTGNYVIPGWIRKPQHHEIVAFVALIRR